MTRHTSALRGLLATIIAAILLAGCATQSAPAGDGPAGSPPPGRPAFAAFTITKTGGFAGVHQQIEVAADGTVRDQTGKVLGHVEGADLTELRALLSGKAIRGEAARTQPSGPGKCADGFNFTLVMKDLRLSDYSCGSPTTKPTLHRVIELTSGSHLKK